MPPGERDTVVDEKTARQAGWVPPDPLCLWANFELTDAQENQSPLVYIKGCEHAGIAILNYTELLMEAPCPKDCFYRRTQKQLDR